MSLQRFIILNNDSLTQKQHILTRQQLMCYPFILAINNLYFGVID